MSFESDTGRDAYFKQLEKELAELIDPSTGLLDQKYSQWVRCLMCEGKQHEELFIKRGYKFVRCITCGLVFSNPQVLPFVLDNVYRNELSSTELWMKVLMNQKEGIWRQHYNKDILEKLQYFSVNKRLLDVGCGIGSFMKCAQNSGWEVTGLEVSPTGRNYAVNTLGMKVLNKNLEEANFGPGSFDAISLLGVLEHVADPQQLLVQCSEVVSDDGVIVVVVPNLYSLSNMFLREKSVTFDGRNHLAYFSIDTLAACFRSANLEPIATDTVLTGIPNITKYIQFLEPYSEDENTQFLPSSLRDIFFSNNGMSDLENMIISNDLGLRIRMFGRKQPKIIS